MRAAAAFLPVLLLTLVPAAAQTSRGGEPNLGSAGAFRNITGTGTTKAPAGARSDSVAKREPDRRRDAVDRKLDTGICIGCD